MKSVGRLLLAAAFCLAIVCGTWWLWSDRNPDTRSAPSAFSVDGMPPRAVEPPLLGSEPTSPGVAPEAEALRGGDAGLLAVRIESVGSPIAGAEVLVVPWDAEVASWAAKPAGIPSRIRDSLTNDVTDANGQLFVTRTWPEAFIAARAPGCAPRGLFVGADSPGTVTIDLPAQNVVTGSVTDENRIPLAGCSILARFDSYRAARDDGEGVTEQRLLGMLFERTVTSAADGSFSMDGLGVGPHLFTASHPGRADAMELRELPTAEPLQLRLRPGASLRGTVLDLRSEQPIEGAIVESRWHDRQRYVPHASCITDANGRFALAVVADTDLPLRVSVRCHGYATRYEHHGPFRSGQALETTIRLEPSQFLDGIVLTTDGQPVGEGHVLAFEADSNAYVDKAKLELDGSFRVEGLRAGQQYDVDVQAPGHAPASTRARAGEGPLEFRLAPSPALGGRVKRSDGEELQGGFVRLAREIEGAIRMETYASELDSTGEFRFDDLPEGRYVVDATADECGVTRLPPIDLRPGHRVLDLEVEVRPSVPVRGRVVAAESGLPIEGALVAIADCDTSGRILAELAEGSRTESDGSFLVDMVAPGGVSRLVVTHEEYAAATAPVHLAADAPEPFVEIRLERPCGMRISRVDDRGLPIPGLAASIDSPGPFRRYLQSAETVLEVGNLPPGPQTVLVARLAAIPGTRAGWKTRIVELAPGETADVRFEVQLTGSVAGRLRGPGVTDIDPLQVQVAFLPAGETEFGGSVTMQPDGSFFLDAVPAGDHEIWVGSWRSDHMLAVRQPVRVTEGETTRVEIEIPSGGIHGRVLDGDGAPIPGAEVYVRERHPGGNEIIWNGMQVSADGSYRLLGCRAGTYDVSGVADGFGHEVAIVHVPNDSAAVERTFRLEPEATLRIRGISAGEPLDDTQLDLLLDGVLDPPTSKPKRDDEGYTVVVGLAPATYAIVLEHPDHFPAQLHATLAPGATTTLDVPLRRHCELTVRVLDPTGQEAAGLPVVLHDETTNSDSRAWLASGWIATEPAGGVTDADGIVHFHGVPEGALRVTAPYAADEVLLAPGAPVDLKLRQLP